MEKTFDIKVAQDERRNHGRSPRWCGGNFGWLHRRYRTIPKSIAMQILPDHAELDQISQEVFLRVRRHHETIGKRWDRNFLGNRIVEKEMNRDDLREILQNRPGALASKQEKLAGMVRMRNRSQREIPVMNSSIS